jgi:hypothetical protein
MDMGASHPKYPFGMQLFVSCLLAKNLLLTHFIIYNNGRFKMKEGVKVQI